MYQHYPRGNRLSAFEKNELKRRAIEMALILFYIEDLRDFVVSSIRSTDHIRTSADKERLPIGVKNPHKKAWAIVVEAGVLTPEESTELQALIDYRNLVAHQIQELTGDIGRNLFVRKGMDSSKYEHKALSRIRYFREKVFSGMRGQFVLTLSFRSVLFEAAEKTYLDELKRLKQKIRRQSRILQEEADQANAEIRRLQQSGLLERLQPGHPKHTRHNGTLSPAGISCCRKLFDAGASPFVVAYLMRLSLRCAKRRHLEWRRIKQCPDSLDTASSS